MRSATLVRAGVAVQWPLVYDNDCVTGIPQMKAIGSLVNSAKNAPQNIDVIGAVVARSIGDGFFERMSK